MSQEFDRIIQQKMEDMDRERTAEEPRQEVVGQTESVTPKLEESGHQAGGSKLPYTLLSEIKEKATEWLWRPRIALGEITVVEGDPATNKSSLLLDLAARVSTGKPMPDSNESVQGGVLLLLAEDSIRKTLRCRSPVV